MKKQLLMILLFFLMSFTTYADSPTLGIGASVFPVGETDVTLLHQDVNINVSDEKVFVESIMVLKNTGKNDTVVMHLPNDRLVYTTNGKEAAHDSQKFNDLKMYVDGKKLPTDRKDNAVGLEADFNLSSQSGYTWEINFDRNQTHRVVITYWVYPAYDEGGGVWLQYAMRPSLLWKSTIGYSKIAVTYGRSFDPQDLTIKEFSSNKNTVIQVFPEDGKLEWVSFDSEPEFDIILRQQGFIEMKRAELFDGNFVSSGFPVMKKVQDLGKEAYHAYFNKDYEKFLQKVNIIETYKNGENDQVSTYVLEMINFLDYYRAKVLLERGDYTGAEYYFKLNGMLNDRNLYDLTEVYKTSGEMDKYIQALNKAVKLEAYSPIVKMWAHRQLMALPVNMKEKYGLTDYIDTTTIDAVDGGETITGGDTENKYIEGFSFKSFILINTGIFILIMVIYWNIRKRS
ncbi:MAG: hypothetical protein ACOYVK_12885 [Bacillota bacterium]